MGWMSQGPCCNTSLWFFVCLSVSESNVVWGGRPKDHAVAQLDAWRRTLAFLHTWLGNAETPHTF